MSERNIRLKFSVESELNKPTEELERLIKLEQSLVEAIKQASLSARADSAAQVTAIAAVSDALEKRRTAQKKTDDEAAASNKQILEGMNTLTSGVKTFTGMIASAFAIGEVKSFVQDIIEAKTQIDSVKISLDTMIGSKRESADLYQQVVQLAKATPFTLQEVSDQVVKLKAYNIETADLIPTITALGNIAAAVGKEKLPQLTLAYGQIRNAGVLMGTELRQLNEAGVPILDLIAKAYGKTAEEVKRMSDDHVISFAMVRKAIMDSSAEGGKYADLMQQMSKTVGGQVSNLADAFQVAKGRIGDFFENQISSGTKTLQTLITTLAGSQAAIQRTVGYVESIAAAFVTWRVAQNAQAVAAAAWSAATKAGDVVMGAYNLTMITLKGTTEGFTRAQQESAVASRTLWASLASNPIGAIVAVVGLAVSAYLAWEAATTDVTNAMGDQEAQLQKEKSELNALAKVALEAEMGTKRRKDAIGELIAKYPDYFAGLDKEKTTNDQLRAILEKVNLSYRDRIDLAREAYKTDKLAEAQKTVFEQEEQLFERVKKTNILNEEVIQSFGGSAQKLSNYMKANGAVANDLNDSWRNLFSGSIGEVARNVAKAQADIAKGYETSAATMQTLREKDKLSSIAAEDEKHKAIMQQLKDGSREEQAEVERHNIAVSKLNGTYKEKEVKATTEHEEKVKQITLLSGNEKAALLMEQNAKTLSEKLKALDAEEKVEMDAVTKATVSKKASAAQIAALEKDASDKLIAIRAETNRKKALLIEEDRRNFEDSLDADINGMQKLIDKTREEQNAYMNRASKFGEFDQQRIRSIKDVAKEAEEAEKKIQEITQETAEIRKKAAEDAKQALVGQRQAVGDLFIGMGALMGQQNEMAGLLSGVLSTTLGNMDLISGKAQQVANNAATNAEAYYNIAKVRFADAGKEGELAIAQAGKNMEVAQAKRNEVSAAAVTTAIGLAGMVLQIAQVIGATFDKVHTQVYQAISSSLGESMQAYNKFYDDLEKLQRESLDLSLAAYEGNFRQQKKLLDEFYDGQREQAKNRDFMNDMLASGKEYADAILAAGRDTVWNHKNYVEQMAQAEIAINRDKYLRQQQMIINQLEIDKQSLKEGLELRLEALNQELQAFTDTKNAEIDKAKEAADNEIAENKRILDEKVAGLQTQIQANKDSYDKNVQAARDSYDKQLTALRDAQSAERTAIQETFDLKKSLLEQAASDEIEAITIVDRLRNEAVDRYGVSEKDKLEKTRDRILATLTSEEEKATVTAFYTNKINELHTTVENAKLDKSLGVQLATKQLNSELKDDTVRLKDEETVALKNLDDSYQIKFKALADERDTKLTTLKDDYLARETKLKADIKTLETTSKNEISKIENDLRDEINKLKDQITQKEDDTTQARKRLNFEYKQAVLQANAQIFEAQRSMLIAQLQAQIAVLNSQKSWTGIGNGKINDAISGIEESIRQIGGIVFNTAPDVVQYLDAYGLNAYGNPKKPLTTNGRGVLDFPVFDAAGNPLTVTYSDSQEVHVVYDANKNEVPIMQATAKDKDGKVLFFEGTDYAKAVNDTSYVERGNNPAGRDTIPAMVNEGERILPTRLNQLLGGAKLSNEHLVDKVLGFEKLTAAFPRMSINTSFPQMGLPSHIMNTQNQQATDIAHLTKAFKSMERTFSNKELVSIKMDEAGFTKAIVRHQSKTILNQSLLTR